MTLTFDDLTEQHVGAIRDALEFYMRCSLGQFGGIADLHDRSERGGDLWEKSRTVDKAVKSILMPDMPTNASYGIGSPKVGTQAKVCYELWKLLGGGTPGEPLGYSGLPLPKVTRKGK